MKTLHSVSIAFCLASGVFAGAAAASADDCDLATSAAIAQAKVPHATTHVTTIPGETTTRAEMIFTADKAYLHTDGAWRSMDYSPEKQIDMINGARKRAEQAKQTCEKGASESVKGEPATLLVMHTEANGKKSEARIWISDKSGLLLKSEIHIDDASYVTIVTDDFRYVNIAAPAGVK